MNKKALLFATCLSISSVLSTSLYAADSKNGIFIGAYSGASLLSKEYKGSVDTLIGGQVGYEFYSKSNDLLGARMYFDTGHTLGAYWYDQNPSISSAFHIYNINVDSIVRPVSWFGIFLGIGVGYHNLVVGNDSIDSIALFTNAGFIFYIGNYINVDLRIRSTTLYVDMPTGNFRANRNAEVTLGVNFIF